MAINQMVQQNNNKRLHVRLSPSAKAYLEQWQAKEQRDGLAKPQFASLIDRLIDTVKARRKAA